MNWFTLKKSDVQKFHFPIRGIALLLAVWVWPSQATVSEDGSLGVFRLQSASLPVETMLNISLFNRIVSMNTEVDPFSSVLADDAITMPDGSRRDASLWASDHVLAASISSHRFIEFHAALPLYNQDLIYNTTPGGGETRNWAVGDLRYGLKLAMPIGGNQSLLAASLSFGGSLPTSGNDIGKLPVPRRIEYYPADPILIREGSRSSGTARDDWHISGAMTLDLEQAAIPIPLQIHANMGSRKTSALSPDDDQFFDIFTWGSGFEGKVSKYVSMLGEYWHESRLETIKNDDISLDEFSIGLGFNTPVGFAVTLGAGFAWDNAEITQTDYSDADGTFQYSFNRHTSPDAQAIIALSYTKRLSDIDFDKDGIMDKVDKCPKDPEDKDGFEDQDGCPENDNDKDGILDPSDKWPNVPEDLDGFEDTDGCPEVDNDKDGIMDVVDKCPMDPEDKDGFEDQDGCPDPDNDKDAILDANDKCPRDGPFCCLRKRFVCRVSMLKIFFA